MKDDLQWKTASNERQLPMEDDLHGKRTSNGRQAQMEMTSNGRRPPTEDKDVKYS